MAHANFVKKARKNYKEEGIKKGDSYWWWKFRFGGVIRSKQKPKLSQLTRSEFLSTVYGIQERLEELDESMELDDVRLEVESIIEEIQTLGEEQTDKRDNMPDQLQDSETGELLQNRADSCEDWASNLSCIDFDEYKDEEEGVSDLIEEIRNNSTYEGE